MLLQNLTRLVLSLLFALLVSPAAWAQASDYDISHSLPPGPKPWTENPVDYDPDTVRFAIFSDLTGSEREGVFELAVEQLNLLRPELIVNVGDLIEGGGNRAELDRQWDSFDVRARKASARVFYTGGNHDLLGEEMRETWADRLGTRYYHFRYRDLLFLVLDTEDHSVERLREIVQLREEALKTVKISGWEAMKQTAYANLPEDETGFISANQSEYMIDALAENPDVRWTFLLMHKAPWANEDMPSWLAIEEALDGRPYTVFHGHRHAYRYEQRNGMDYLRLATTGGVFLPANGTAIDQVVWVTVDQAGAHIANLKMSGILDKTGRLPIDGEIRCLEATDCPSE